MRPGDRRTKTMDRDPNTESKAQCLAELSSLSLPDSIMIPTFSPTKREAQGQTISKKLSTLKGGAGLVLCDTI